MSAFSKTLVTMETGTKHVLKETVRFGIFLASSLLTTALPVQRKLSTSTWSTLSFQAVQE